jgi:hypothetical protein
MGSILLSRGEDFAGWIGITVVQRLCLTLCGNGFLKNRSEIENLAAVDGTAGGGE